MRFRSLFAFVLSSLGYFNVLFGQTAPQITLYNNPAIKSPETESLGKYGDVPVSAFNGLPQINIPLLEITDGPVKVPLSLTYNAGGFKSDERPGWTGLGWSLMAGGAITRQANGSFDEGILLFSSVKNSYYDRYGKLGTAAWTNATSTNFGDYFASGDYGNQDLSPDIFNFTFLGISGSFMLNHEGKWVIKSKDGLFLKVDHQVVENYVVSSPDNSAQVTLPRVFTSFTITDRDGTKYVFGGAQKAIEFSFPALPNTTESYNSASPPGPQRAINYCPYSSSCPYAYVKEVQSTAWYLTQIIAPTGQTVTFTYKNAYSLQQYTYSQISSVPNTATSGGVYKTFDINQTSKFLVQASYLDMIETDNGIKCALFKSVANDLPNPIKTKPQSSDGFYLGGATVNLTPGSVHYKLDSVALSYNNELKKKISITYLENSSQRLKLTAVAFRSLQDASLSHSYKIDYNTKLLPAYNTGMDDHWGYYNGKNYFGTTFAQTETAYPNQTDYYNSREPDPSFMDGEMIKKITYPTGGWTEFEFEPHDYSSVVTFNPSSPVSAVGQNKTGGGMRLRKVIDNDGTGNLQNVKEFFYVKDYINGGTASSGVLSGIPKYYEEGNTAIGNGTYKKFSSAPINTLSTTNGNHITYSEVTQKNGNNGFVVFTYRNHDNGSADNGPILQTMAPYGAFDRKGYASRELERGAPLSRKIYSATKGLLTEESMEYNNDPARFKIYVRSIESKSSYAYTSNFVVYPIYTFFPYMKKSVLTEYNGGNSIVTTKEYTYENQYNMLRTYSYTDSKGNQNSTDYSYAFDMIAGEPANGVYHTMLDKNMLLKVSEELKKDGVSKGYSKLNFSVFANNLLPATNEVKVNSNPSEIASRIHSYDNRGNLQSFSKENDIKESYVWGYNNSYPIAKVINADASEIFFDGLEEANGWQNVVYGWPEMSYDNNKSHTGKSAGKIYNPNSSEYYYHSAKWLTISQTAPKKFKYSGWFYSDGPQAEILLFMKRAGETGYYSYVDGVSMNTIGKWTYVEKEYEVPADVVQLNIRIDNNGGGTVWFDDIRLHPSIAQMTTFTLSPLVGITSESDINNRITLYEYDAFNRLIVIRDKDNNILKRICYNYAGQPGVCTLFGNQSQSGTFTRNNCTGSAVGSQVTYTVPSNKYSATTQPDANNLAFNDINANGQAYANANGTCTIPPTATVSGQNTTTNIYAFVQFTNTSTGAYYSLYIYPNSTTSISMPAGTYNISFSQSSSPQVATTFRVNAYSSYGTSATFSYMNITTGSVVRVGN